MTEKPTVPGATSAPVPRSRRRLRSAAIGGIAAIAILGGGIGAVAAASAPSTTGSATAGTPTPAPASGGASSTSTTAPKPPDAPVHQPHLDGTVTKVSASTVLIKDREGFTRTIVLSSRTTYIDGLTAALKVGAKIHAEGAVDANGTSLDATSVGADQGPGRGPGGRPGGPRGPAGPGGPLGHRAGPPTGTATPSTSAAKPTA